jgi:hypothetical protein
MDVFPYAFLYKNVNAINPHNNGAVQQSFATLLPILYMLFRIFLPESENILWK